VGVAAKKRKKSKGLSGNPQKRAEQTKELREADQAREQYAPGPGTGLGGRPRSWPWWAQSHAAVLDRVREAEWPARLLDAETLAGRIAGDEFHGRLNAPGQGTGLTPVGWLSALNERAQETLAADWADDGKDWRKLWAFCCGAADKTTIGDLEVQAQEIAADGERPAPGIPVPWYRPTADTGVLMARDAYGDRFLLAAPFSDPARPTEVDHWYAWDVDWCALGLVVGASAHEDADSALAEWRGVVGPAAGSAGFEPCAPAAAIRLLEQAIRDSLQADSAFGDEPAEYFREFGRLRRRASALAEFLARQLPTKPSGLAEARDAGIDEFLTQYAGRAWKSPEEQIDAEDVLDLLLSEWGPDATPDEPAFFACSPHRIEHCATLLRDMYQPEAVDPVLAMLPDWVQWCARRTGLGAEYAELALAAARREAATPAAIRVPERDVPFRRPE
jgi:hypothetical protein